MKKYQQLTLLVLSSILAGLFIPSHRLVAQSTPPLEFGNPPANIDDLPNDPQQQRTWQCVNNDKSISVEAKDIKSWQSLIEGEGWQCIEDALTTPIDKPKFSCEPDETIGILTVFWLEGSDGKQQMQSWMNDLDSNHGLSCTVDRDNPFWN